MSFFQHNMLTTFPSKFDEKQWVTQIRQTLDEDIDEEIETPVTIFSVPKALMICDPDSYIPQQVAIGPYHHLRPELYDMERYKVAAAKRNQMDFDNVKLQAMVDHLMKLDLRIRACYHRPLSYGSEALAWMMAIDVSFLFEFLQVCGVKVGKFLAKTPSRLAHLIDKSGNKTAHNTILRDIIMLENQIPLFVLRMLFEMQFSSPGLADEMLLAMLNGLSKDLSPFKMVECSQSTESAHHLLDYLYNYIVPKEDVTSLVLDIELDEEDDGCKKSTEGDDSFAKPSHLSQFFHVVWQIISSIAKGPIEGIKRLIFSKPLKVIIKLPWTILTKIPIVKMLKEPMENMFNALHKDHKEKEDEGDESSSSSNNIQKPPLQEEIAIPSVTQLLEAGVQFLPTSEGISTIKFDDKTLTFYVPMIKLDVNSEVVLRNLVAYEACSASGPLVLTRYTELMNGIIDSDVDAKFLCQRGIIVNHLKSEKEVADLWNGMSKSVRLTKVPSLDKVIADVNRFYSGRWKVKFGKFMKEYVFGSWRFLTFIAAIAMLILMCLQAFCQVYSCSRILRIKALESPTTS